MTSDYANWAAVEAKSCYEAHHFISYGETAHLAKRCVGKDASFKTDSTMELGKLRELLDYLQNQGASQEVLDQICDRFFAVSADGSIAARERELHFERIVREAINAVSHGPVTEPARRVG